MSSRENYKATVCGLEASFFLVPFSQFYYCVKIFFLNYYDIFRQYISVINGI
jgi:hypothetical protein